MKRACCAAASLMLLLMTSASFAHEGHGNPEWISSAIHYLIEPAHLSLSLPAVIAALLIGGWARCRAQGPAFKRGSATARRRAGNR